MPFGLRADAGRNFDVLRQHVTQRLPGGRGAHYRALADTHRRIELIDEDHAAFRARFGNALLARGGNGDGVAHDRL